MTKKENIVLSAFMFALGAALVVAAIANVIMAAAILVVHGGSGFDTNMWSTYATAGAGILSFIGFVLIFMARTVTDSGASNGEEKPQ